MCKNNLPVPYYTIGLVCAGTYSRDYIRGILGYKKIEYNNIDDFIFRDKTVNGWPGDISFIKDGGKETVPSMFRHRLKKSYSCFCCLYCFDQMNIFSDLTVGDPWGFSQKMIPAGYGDLKDGFRLYWSEIQKVRN
jgi:coenzyme F420-reducing hydrogenase beta subunit